MPPENHSDRLEALWSGDFGDDYVDRNLESRDARRIFWEARLAEMEVESVLEVGCNVGGNLEWLASMLAPERVAGVDVNEKALELLRERVPGVDARRASAVELPFADGSFDLVFTTGVLIHQDPADLPRVMAEIVRCSRRYVLCGEYHADELVEVPYRGHRGALFKQDYGALYQSRFPELQPLGQGFLSREDTGWDDVTWWTFEKRSA